MTRIFLKLVLLLVMLIGIKIASSEDEVSYRLAELARQEYDTVLIGSSRTQYGVKPAYLDALRGNRTKTYNFGISAGSLPYTIDWCEAAIKGKKSLRYVLFELSGSGGVARRNARPWLKFRLDDYWKDIRSYSFGASSAYHDSLALILLRPEWAVTYFDNNTSLERLHEPYPFMNMQIPPGGLSSLQRRNETVEKSNTSISVKRDAQLWQRVLGLIQLADSAGVQLYFFIPPRLQTDSEVETVHQLWHKLDERRRLHVDHAASALYAPENSADLFHLNHRGALRFTEILAAALKP